MKRLLALLRQRCPVCLEGAVFKGIFGMHSHCPVCGIKYERETGYFLNSMFIGYTVGFFILVPTAVWLFFLNVDLLVFSTVVILETVLIYPLIFRYSRLVWMYGDQLLDPRKPADVRGPDTA